MVCKRVGQVQNLQKARSRKPGQVHSRVHGLSAACGGLLQPWHPWPVSTMRSRPAWAPALQLLLLAVAAALLVVPAVGQATAAGDTAALLAFRQQIQDPQVCV